MYQSPWWSVQVVCKGYKTTQRHLFQCRMFCTVPSFHSLLFFCALCSWYKVVEIMDNYQEWDDPAIILEGSKPIISPFITGYHSLHYMFSKLIYLMFFCTFEASTITRKTIIYKLKTMFKTNTSIPKAISNWINKLWLCYTKKRRKTSHGSGNFSKNLRASKHLWYNERNYTSGSHGHWHTFRKYKSQTRHTTMNTSNPALKIKSR